MNTLLEVRGVHKAFAAVKALSNVSFSVRPGEVHALMGENGAGKSTIIKIFTGVYTKDSGQIFFEEKEVAPATALEAQLIGISTIYQELNLSPYLSVAENIFLGREIKNKFGAIDWAKTNQEADRRLQEMGIFIDVKKTLLQYSTAIQQMISIVRALVIDAKLIVMDEPTSSLDSKEVQILFDVIKRLKSMGISVIYVSHRMEEIFTVCDRVTVLKDGECMGTHDIEDLNVTKLLSMMLGRDATSILERTKVHDLSKQQGKVVCSVKDIRKGNVLSGVDFEIHEGEVLGLAGLLGSGRTELAKIIFGEDQFYTGKVAINGVPVHFASPKDAIKNHLAYCSEDRKIEGIFPHMDIKDNLTAAVLPQLTKGGVIQRKKQQSLCDDYIKRLAVKTPSAKNTISKLSGGNQQKVVLARWLCMNPRLVILDEPTRGIDVGAKSEIEKLIQSLSDSGIAVLFISSEIEELVRGCDRVVVLYEGQKACELIGDEISYQNIVDEIAACGEKVRAGAKSMQGVLQ
ncbi:sugar ABC transporter ATP-binding protein [Oscillospiraceae bacterium MB08-C2-2]|nr:sugar ABC transporter ATP-binding protein [Oscillospiraceae bacterium MB08-C2-2]